MLLVGVISPLLHRYICQMDHHVVKFGDIRCVLLGTETGEASRIPKNIIINITAIMSDSLKTYIQTLSGR